MLISFNRLGRSTSQAGFDLALTAIAFGHKTTLLFFVGDNTQNFFEAIELFYDKFQMLADLGITSIYLQVPSEELLTLLPEKFPLAVSVLSDRAAKDLIRSSKKCVSF